MMIYELRPRTLHSTILAQQEAWEYVHGPAWFQSK